MNLKLETWELITEGLEDEIIKLTKMLEDRADQYSDYVKSTAEIKNTLLEKCNEVTELKRELAQYKKREEIEHFIKTLGRRYIAREANLTWESIFYVLYPSADEHEYHKRGKAKEAIIDLLRSQELGFDEDGTIFRSH